MPLHVIQPVARWLTCDAQQGGPICATQMNTLDLGEQSAIVVIERDIRGKRVLLRRAVRLPHDDVIPDPSGRAAVQPERIDPNQQEARLTLRDWSAQDVKARVEQRRVDVKVERLT